MAEQGSYDQLIADVERRTEDARRKADARAQGEANRRGLTNPAGTSDIEMALRQSQTAPIVQGGQSDIANILAQIAQTKDAQRYGTSEREARQKYGTSERVGSQDFSRGERMGTQDWKSGENVLQRGFLGDQAQQDRYQQLAAMGYIDPTKTEGYRGGSAAWNPYTSKTDQWGKSQNLYGARGEAERGRVHEHDMMQLEGALSKPKKRKWYEGAISPLAQGAATGATYKWLS